MMITASLVTSHELRAVFEYEYCCAENEDEYD